MSENSRQWHRQYIGDDFGGSCLISFATSSVVTCSKSCSTGKCADVADVCCKCRYTPTNQPWETGRDVTEGGGPVGGPLSWIAIDGLAVAGLPVSLQPTGPGD